MAKKATIEQSDKFQKVRQFVGKNQQAIKGALVGFVIAASIPLIVFVCDHFPRIRISIEWNQQEEAAGSNLKKWVKQNCPDATLTEFQLVSAHFNTVADKLENGHLQGLLDTNAELIAQIQPDVVNVQAWVDFVNLFFDEVEKTSCSKDVIAGALREAAGVIDKEKHVRAVNQLEKAVQVDRENQNLDCGKNPESVRGSDSSLVCQTGDSGGDAAGGEETANENPQNDSGTDGGNSIEERLENAPPKDSTQKSGNSKPRGYGVFRWY